MAKFLQKRQVNSIKGFEVPQNFRSALWTQENIEAREARAASEVRRGLGPEGSNHPEICFSVELEGEVSRGDVYLVGNLKNRFEPDTFLANLAIFLLLVCFRTVSDLGDGQDMLGKEVFLIAIDAKIAVFVLEVQLWDVVRLVFVVICVLDKL